MFDVIERLGRQGTRLLPIALTVCLRRSLFHANVGVDKREPHSRHTHTLSFPFPPRPALFHDQIIPLVKERNALNELLHEMRINEEAAVRKIAI